MSSLLQQKPIIYRYTRTGIMLYPASITKLVRVKFDCALVIGGWKFDTINSSRAIQWRLGTIVYIAIKAYDACHFEIIVTECKIQFHSMYYDCHSWSHKLWSKQQTTNKFESWIPKVQTAEMLMLVKIIFHLDYIICAWRIYNITKFNRKRNVFYFCRNMTIITNSCTVKNYKHNSKAYR